MSYRGWCAICALALSAGGFLPASALGGEMFMSVLSWHPLSGATTSVDGATGSTPLKIVPVAPPSRFAQPAHNLYRRPSTAQPVPRFEWGNFGARYHYKGGSHIGYYGDTFGWWFKKH
jgi:hypothetical protein